MSDDEAKGEVLCWKRVESKMYHEVDDLEVYRIMKEGRKDFEVFIGAMVKRYLRRGTVEP